MKSLEITSTVVRSIAFILLMTTLCLAKLNTKKQGFINTKDIKILPSSSTLKIETATSSVGCSTICCMLGSCCYASYDKKTKQCILEESCCPQGELSGEALMMKKSTDSFSCQIGWFKKDNKCYYFSDVTANWNDAKSICESYDSMLVEVISSCELDFVKTKAAGYASSFWLGGIDIDSTNNWTWSTSQTDITFNDWDVGQPNNFNGNENCLRMKEQSGLTWNDGRCMLEIRFICEKNLFN